MEYCLLSIRPLHGSFIFIMNFNPQTASGGLRGPGTHSRLPIPFNFHQIHTMLSVSPLWSTTKWYFTQGKCISCRAVCHKAPVAKEICHGTKKHFDAITAAMSIPEHSDVLNSDSDFVCPSSSESDESDDISSHLEEPHDVHKAEAGTQWSNIPLNSSRTYARNIIRRPIKKI